MSEQDYYPQDPQVEALKAELTGLKSDLGNLIGTTRQAQQAEIQELSRKLTASEIDRLRGRNCLFTYAGVLALCGESRGVA